jgi:hypothetical protein
MIAAARTWLFLFSETLLLKHPLLYPEILIINAISIPYFVLANCDSVINAGHKHTSGTLNLKRLRVTVKAKSFLLRKPKQSV